MIRNTSVEKINVLVVEDNEDDLFFIQKALSDVRYNLTSIMQGEDAYRYLQNPQTIPDIVLLDNQLPGMNGLQIIENLQNENLNYTYIFLTIDNTIDTVIKAMKAGALDFIVKSAELKNQLPEKMEKVYKIYCSITERKKTQVELINVNKELLFQNEEKEKLVAQLITAKEKTEESEEKFRQLAENTNEIFWVRTENQMLYINPAFEKIFGMPCEMIYKNAQIFTDLIHPDDRPSVLSMLQFKETEFFDSEYRIIRPDNQMRWLRVKSYPIYGEAGKIIRRAGIAVDITEGKLQELQKEKMTNDLIQRNKALEQFSYILSHNLRSPLSTIMGLTEMLQDKDLPKEEVEYINESLAKSAMRLDEVVRDINQILDVRQGIADKKELVHFTELTSNILMNIEAIVAKKNAVVTWDFSQVDEMVTVKSYIYSIFYNLISNSLKYSQRDIPPRVEISSEIVNNKIILHFKDNGMGIDLEKQGDKIFGLYKRFHSDHAEGKGMGLFMVKTQVETIGGTISVSSEVNKGTKFSLEFEI